MPDTTIELYPAGIPMTALAVDVEAVGITATRAVALVFVPDHLPAKRLFLTIPEADASRLHRLLGEVMKVREAERSNSN